jgi:hypothetical protein
MEKGEENRTRKSSLLGYRILRSKHTMPEIHHLYLQPGEKEGIEKLLSQVDSTFQNGGKGLKLELNSRVPALLA